MQDDTRNPGAATTRGGETQTSQPLPPEVAEEAHTYDPNMNPDRPPEEDSGLRVDPETGQIDPESIGQVGADAAVGAVDEAGGSGETIEEAGEPILDSPGVAEAAFIPPWITGGVPSEPAPSEPANTAPDAAAPADAGHFGPIKVGDGEEAEFLNPSGETYVDEHGKVWVPKNDYDDAARDLYDAWEYEDSTRTVDAFADAAEDVGESTVDFVEGIPIIGDDIGDALRDGYDVVEDVVDHADDPVVEDVDPWA